MKALRPRIEALEKRDMPPEPMTVEVRIVCADTGLMANGEPPPPPEPGDLYVLISPHE